MWSQAWGLPTFQVRESLRWPGVSATSSSSRSPRSGAAVSSEGGGGEDQTATEMLGRPPPPRGERGPTWEDVVLAAPQALGALHVLLAAELQVVGQRCVHGPHGGLGRVVRCRLRVTETRGRGRCLRRVDSHAHRFLEGL